MCCGQKRAALRSQAASTRPAVPMRPGVIQPNASSNPRPPVSGRIAAPALALVTPVTVRYLKNSPVRVRGAVSGRQYDFSSSRPAQQVDRRDLSGLLRTGFFRQG